MTLNNIEKINNLKIDLIMGTLTNGIKEIFASTVGSSSHKIPLLDSSGNPAGSNTMANVGKFLQQACPTIGNVVVVTNVDSYTRFWPADRALESSISSIAVGAGIIENGRTLIVAKDTQNKKWAESTVSGGNTAISDRRNAIADFNGKENTDTIITTLGADAPAATYCRGYYPSNVDAGDSNMGAGRWWLPSLGELAMIWAHVRQVNFVLAAIGGTQIPVGSGFIWSSTEHSATSAWRLYANYGYFTYYSKTNELSVRPVSAFY